MAEIYKDEQGYTVQELKGSRKDALIKEIKSLVLDPKTTKLPVDRLAEKYECSRADIFSAKNKIIMSLPQQNVDFVKKKFALQFENLELLAEDLVNNSEDNEDLRKNIDTMLKIIKEKTDYLERFHLKRKATEQINVDGELKVTSINVKIIDSVSPKVVNGTFIDKVDS